jgi:hypothetical protein
VVQLLIQHGADVHAMDDEALRHASINNHTAVVQLLIQHGAALPPDAGDMMDEDDEDEDVYI